MSRLGELVAASIATAKALARPSSPPSAVWASLDFLQQPKAGDDFPIWVPPTGDTAAFADVSVARALGAGLKITPIETTVRDTRLACHSRRREYHAPEAPTGKTSAAAPSHPVFSAR